MTPFEGFGHSCQRCEKVLRLPVLSVKQSEALCAESLLLLGGTVITLRRVASPPPGSDSLDSLDSLDRHATVQYRVVPCSTWVYGVPTGCVKEGV